jgi:uncharacterized protein YceK
MKTITTRFLTVVLLTITLALGSGCAAVVVGAAAGAGAVIYSNGELRSDEATGFDKAWDASLAAMHDLNYAVVEREKGPVDAKLVARAYGDKKITVKVEKVTGTVSKIKIRVGTFGDEVQSKDILEAIQKRL